ncbi:MAG: sulfatase family protein [Planctomycetota bacterium]|jgi:arylsulfatase A-like enzyme
MGKPNVLLVVCDDIGFGEIGPYLGRGIPDWDVYDGEKVFTPNLDAIAGGGAIFTRHYATSSICTPSRYSILTGRLACRSPSIAEAFPPPSPATITWNTRVDRGEGNLAKAMKAMGYATGFFGKWHTGAPKPEVASEDGSDPRDPAFAARVRADWERRVDHLRDGFGFDRVDRVYFGNREGFPRQLQVHNLEWIVEGALDFVDEHAEDPFFLYVALSTPHGDQLSRFDEVDPLLTPAGVLQKRPEVMPPREGIRERVRAAGASERTAMSTWMDDAVGALLSRLAERGLADDTAVIFTCDHLARGKYMCYEGSRVPFLVRFPGRIPGGVEVDALTANVDLAATVCELAGGALPNGYETDGTSFAPLLLDPGAAGGRRDHVYLECSNIRGVVTDRWKYIVCRAGEDVLAAIEADRLEAEAQGRKRWVGWDGRRNPHAHYEREGVRYFSAGEFPGYFDADQLYDLEADPWEQKNLAFDPAHAETLARMKSLLAEELRGLPWSFGEFTG